MCWIKKDAINLSCFYFQKNGKQYSVDQLFENLCKLLYQDLIQELADKGRESLIRKTIRYKWRDENGLEQWYSGEELSKVVGTDR